MRFFRLCGIFASLAWAQDFQNVMFERNAAGHRFTDAPLWSATVGGALFADVPNNTIHAFIPGKGVAVFKKDLLGPSGLAYDPQGRLVVAETRGRRLIRFPKANNQKFDILVDQFEGKKFNAPNDLVIRKDGQLYFTDPAFGSQEASRELDFYGVFHLNSKGEISVVAKPQGRPGGLALSPDGKILYVTNSDERRVYAYDLDGKGVANNERVLISQTEGVPAGIETDEKGNLYVAENKLRLYSPEGKLLDAAILSEKPSNVAFGDPDGLSLYITARHSLYRTRVKIGGAGFDPKSPPTNPLAQ
ncbi:MAG: SMP-30/gluconolactonase/LRE family protein [Bryobacter sp.]|nr:SMP-30/gluconolactonase/LRE family protein [Bryobacter sp.]